MKHWAWLAAAILFEVGGTTSMKLSQGFTRSVPSTLMFVLYALSFSALTIAVERISISTAYAIWSGIGTALITSIGILHFREPATLLRMMFILLIIGGVVGLHLTSEGS
ncbi:MAG TPA: multidrug efflux SMR transporter [Nitrospiria bacterium]|nr:multidrug efflux SMR transporter [Nitrospiria bacterium]